MLTVTHVVRQFYPAIGGLENFVLDLAKCQIEQGLKVKVVTLNQRYDTNEVLAENEEIDGIEVVRVPFKGSKKYPVAPSAFKQLKGSDVVHVHAIDFFVDFLAASKLLHKKPLVVSTHGGFFHTKFAQRLKKVYFNTVTRVSLSAANHVVSCSENDHELFSKLHPNKTTLIENGINTDKFAGAPSTHSNKQMLFIGRFSNNKRIDLLLDWFAQLNKHDPEFKLVIAGKDWDDNYAKLQSQVAKLGLSNSVEFVIEASEKQLASIVAKSSYVVSASEYEGFGMTIIECMAGGLIPVMSDIKSFSKILHATGCGSIVDFNDAQSAANWLSNIDSHQQIIEQKQRSAEQALNYSWPKVSQQFNALYQQVLSA